MSCHLNPVYRLYQWLAETVPEVEDTRCWQDSSEEQFFPLELDGVQEVNLNVSEPKRRQLCEILLSFPQVLATQPESWFNILLVWEM